MKKVINYKGIELVVGNRGDIWYKGKKLRQFLNKKTGYMTSSAWDSKNKKYVQLPIHRVVCMAFHPNPDADKLHVDHIDNDKKHNCQSNLRFVSRKFNNSRKHARRLKSENNMKTTHSDQMIRAENVSTGEVLYFRNGIDAARGLDCSTPFVYMALTGKTPLCKGYMLKWIDRESDEVGRRLYEEERRRREERKHEQKVKASIKRRREYAKKRGAAYRPHKTYKGEPLPSIEED